MYGVYTSVQPPLEGGKRGIYVPSISRVLPVTAAEWGIHSPPPLRNQVCHISILDVLCFFSMHHLLKDERMLGRREGGSDGENIENFLRFVFIWTYDFKQLAYIFTVFLEKLSAFIRYRAMVTFATARSFFNL